MSDSRTGYFYQHWIVDTVDTPVGKNGLAQAPLCNTVNSASQTILSHMERAMSATGKTEVGGKLPLCSFAKFILPAVYEKHMPRPAKVYPRETRQTLSLFELAQKQRPRDADGLESHILSPNNGARTLKSQVVLLRTTHSWANARVLLGGRMHRERGSFRNN